MTSLAPPAGPITPRESRRLHGLLIVAGLLLSATVVPGVFIVDELNYLSTVVGLRNGSWHVPGTEDLPPSRELAAFDPEDQDRVITSTPISSLAPPLYALIALPLSYFGWASLFLMNILAFLVICWLLYAFVRVREGSPVVAGIALALFALGGFSLEYAIGMWPHMQSVACVTGAFVCGSRGRTSDSMTWAALGGFLAGWSVGIREQNILLAGGLGLSVFVLSTSRWRLSSGYLAGLMLPLLIIACLNGERLGLFHPFPKVLAVTTELQRSETREARDPLEPVGVVWAKLVDMRTHPPFEDDLKRRLLRHDPSTGVPLVGSVVKKAVLQSAPWTAAGFLFLLIGWRFRTTLSQERRRDLLAIALTTAPLLLVMALAGFDRSDGRAFNQRYFLELVPLLAIASAYACISARVDLRHFLASSVVGLVVSLVVVVLFGSPTRYALIASVPLASAVAVVCSMVLALFASRGSIAFAWALGCALGWSLFIHVADDLRGSLEIRHMNLAVARAVEPHVAPGSAIFAYWGSRDALGPLMLTRNALILDAWADGGAAAPELTSALLRKGRRVFVRTDAFPEPLLRDMTVGSFVDTIRTQYPRLVEIARHR